MGIIIERHSSGQYNGAPSAHIVCQGWEVCAGEIFVGSGNQDGSSFDGKVVELCQGGEDDFPEMGAEQFFRIIGREGVISAFRIAQHTYCRLFRVQTDAPQSGRQQVCEKTS